MYIIYINFLMQIKEKIKNMIGPSPTIYLVEKVGMNLSCRGGSDSHILTSTSELPY